jgi:rhodanese-related sulfurtransferase
MSVKTISPRELQQKRQAGEPIDLIDVRTPAEFQEVHIEGSRLAPLDRLDPAAFLAGRNGSAGRPLYLICRTGNRARQAGEKLSAVGLADVACVEGGVKAWEEAGLPVRRGKKTISLERQVRIAAGLLVLIGAVLGFFVHPYFIALSAFVGAGLVYAGITDTCGMAMLLARMPWNQVGPPEEDAPKAERKEESSPSCCSS